MLTNLKDYKLGISLVSELAVLKVLCSFIYVDAWINFSLVYPMLIHKHIKIAAIGLSTVQKIWFAIIF